MAAAGAAAAAGLFREERINRLQTRRQSNIYDDLPVSMASKLNYDEDSEYGGGSEGRSTHDFQSTDQISDDDPGPIKKKFLPFFRKFWPHFRKDSDNIPRRRTFNPRLYGKAVEEVDPFVFEDTFCVLTKKFGKHYVFRFSGSRSLFLFGPMNSFRRLCIYITTHHLFDLLIILTILSNCVALAFDNNEIVEDGSQPGQYVVLNYNLPSEVEWGFLIIYTIEMVLKTVAKGFILNKFSYLRNGWNILDFVVVVSGYVTEILFYKIGERSEAASTMDVLRTFRVLRAIKTISILPGLRMMINALINAMTQLIEVMLLTAFCLCVFALFALEVYMGKLHQICVLIRGSGTANQSFPGIDLTPIQSSSFNIHYQYKEWITDRNNWLKRDFPKEEYVPCANETGRECPKDYVCLPNLGDNPDDGWTSFDTFFKSMLSTFQLVTLDYWERLYELVMSTSGPWCLPFFIGVVFFGSFYLLNLMLAVVAMSYEAEAHSWEQKPLTKHQKLSLHRSNSTFSFDEPLKLNVALLTQYHKKSPAEKEMLARTLRNASIGKRKKRRAIKRKLLMKPKSGESGGGRDGGGGGSNSGTGACTPDARSTTGSVCGSMFSGGLDGQSLTPLPVRPHSSKSSNKSLMSGVLGERPIPKPKSASSVPITSKKHQKPKRVVTIDDGDKIVNIIPRRNDGEKFVVEPINSSSSPGVRISGRVKAYDDNTINKTRFYLETEGHLGEEDGNGDGGGGDSRKPSTGSLSDTLMNMLGRNFTQSTSPPPSRSNELQFQQTKDSEQEDRAEKSTEEITFLNAAESQSKQAQNFCSSSPIALPPTDNKNSESVLVHRKMSRVSGTGHVINLESPSGGGGTSENKIEQPNLEPLSGVVEEAKEALEKVKSRLDPLVTHWAFELVITGCIILNTLILASEHHGQPEWLSELIQISSHCFTAVFTFECVIKIIALQKDYFVQYWNLFDLFIVLVSFVDLILSILLGSNVAIRVVRLLRVFKLAQSWLTMKVLLNIIFSTFGALGNLTLILIIFIYIFAVLGMQIIGPKYTPAAFEADTPFDENFPRWNFQDFWHSFMMIFRVICGEWIEPLWDCLAAHKHGSEFKCFFIFLPVLVIGNFIILNLFLALLLNSFNTEELKAQKDKEKEISGKVDNLKKVVGMLMTKNIPEAAAVAVAQIELKQEVGGGTNGSYDSRNSPMSSLHSRESLQYSPNLSVFESSPSKIRFQSAVKKVIIQNRKEAAEKAIQRAEEKLGYTIGSISRKDSSLQPDDLKNVNFEEPPKITPIPADCFPKVIQDLNCFLFKYSSRSCSSTGTWFKARTISLKIVSHPVFEWGILALILASSITLCFEDIYLEQKKELKLILFILNNIFTGIFVFEMILKWMALGVYQYFTSFWTILDVFIVTVSLVTLGFDISNSSWLPITDTSQKKSAVSSLKALRTLRALRPLRAISRWQGMKVVVNALMYAIPSIVNVLLVCLLFWLVFAIMGVQFFKGKFFKCVYENGSTVPYTLVQNRDQCCGHPDKFSWINTTPNFDNVFEGYLSLFQVATFEGWMELMAAASDAIDENENMNRDSRYISNVFFVVFIIFGSFFTLNLFIGVIIDNFNMLKKKYEGNLLEVLLTPSQRRYYTAMKKLGRKKPKRVIRRPLNKCLAIFYDISMSRRFEIAIFILIFLNMLVMAFEHHGQKQIFAHVLSGCNSFFSTIYALEAVVKIVGMRHFYFTIPWNVFDFCLVLFSVIDLFLTDGDLNLPFPPTLLRVVRVFRIGRVLRLIKAAKGIRKLLFALIVSLPALFNIGALLALITFIYAILGMALFKDAANYEAIDELFNFSTFPRASLMLLRLMTAAGWNDVLDALTVSTPECGNYRKLKCGPADTEPDCVSRIASVLYMVSYIIISFLIVINMYIAIILENFVEANQDEEVGIVEDDLEMFYVRWSRYDPTATQFINFDQLSEFLACLDPPLDIPRPNMVAIVSFNLPIARGNKIHCLDILHALVKHALGHVEESEEFRKIQEQMEAKFRKQFPSRKLLDIVSSTRIWKMQHNAAIVIQRAWKAYRQRKYAPQEMVKSTQTIRSVGSTGHGLGHAMNRIGAFFHVGDHSRRRKSSVREHSTFLFTRRRTSDKKSDSPSHQTLRQEDQLSPKFLTSRIEEDPPSQEEEPETPLPTQRHHVPRNSISSQSTVSSASPMMRIDPGVSISGGGLTTEFQHPRGRRLSPSRLSGGSFDVAVNYGNNGCMSPPINSQLLAIHLPKSSASKSPSPVLGQTIKETPGVGGCNSINIRQQSISYTCSPLASCPTTPSSPRDFPEDSNVVVQVYDLSNTRPVDYRKA